MLPPAQTFANVSLRGAGVPAGTASVGFVSLGAAGQTLSPLPFGLLSMAYVNEKRPSPVSKSLSPRSKPGFSVRPARALSSRGVDKLTLYGVQAPPVVSSTVLASYWSPKKIVVREA